MRREGEKKLFSVSIFLFAPFLLFLLSDVLLLVVFFSQSPKLLSRVELTFFFLFLFLGVAVGRTEHKIPS